MMLDSSHTISDQRVVLAEILGALDPQDTVEKGYLEMGWTGKETCIKCDQGGKVLVCSESGCPLAVHEECMPCSARFDDLGNFYCPYCIYKRAILESCKAKKKAMLAKKALSGFLDKGMIDSEQQKQKAENVKGEKPKLSTVVEETDHFVQTEEDQQEGNFDPECTKRAMLAKKALSGFLDKEMIDSEQQKQKTENVKGKEPKLSTVVGETDHFVQIEEDQQQGNFDPKCTTSILPCKGVEISSMNEGNNVGLLRDGDNAGLDDRDQNEIVVEQRIHPDSIIASVSGGKHCREEESGHQFKMVQAAERFQAEHQRHVDDKVVEDEEQAEPFSASPVEEDIDVALRIPTKGKQKSAEILDKNEGRTVEEEEIQERVQDTIASSSGRNPAPQVHAKSSHSLSQKRHQKRSTVSTRLRHVKKKNRSVVHHPQNVSTPRRSSRKLSFEPDTTSEQNEKNITTKKPRQFQKPSTRQENPTFPKVRRKKRRWTEEEEEMLKVGVQRYSTKVNKNLPWRKILEFGCDVFDGTRTPVDLKDKWRNMLGKRCSTNQ